MGHRAWGRQRNILRRIRGTWQQCFYTTQHTLNYTIYVIGIFAANNLTVAQTPCVRSLLLLLSRSIVPFSLSLSSFYGARGLKFAFPGFGKKRRDATTPPFYTESASGAMHMCKHLCFTTPYIIEGLCQLWRWVVSFALPAKGVKCQCCSCFY